MSVMINKVTPSNTFC